MATAVHRRPTSTAGLTSSQSQNSAPVFEFRCMFTHDVRKKAKKWHDGSVRFHTFNRRVMVYDDTKNLVGCLHYRSQDDFVEGLELSLDSHVLVRVEERLSESTTDLTPLLSRQKQDGADHFVRPDPPTRATLSRVNAANSQVKPKSIKELLAGSQGSIGRARLPNKSPYEERHPLTESQPPEPEPEPKRRKIVPDKENTVEAPQRIRPATKRTTPVVHTQPSPPSGIVDISSDDEVITLPRKGGNNTQTRAIPSEPSEVLVPPPNTTSNVKRSVAPPPSAEPKRHKKDQQTQSEFPLPRPKEQVPKKTNKTHKEPSEKTVKPSSAPPVLPNPSTSEIRISQIRHPAGPRSSLKFATEKSRPKLIYRALLVDSSKPASDINSTAATNESVKDTSSSRSHDNEPRVRRTRPTNVIDTDRFFAPSQLVRDADVAAAAAEPSHDSPTSDALPSPDLLENEDAQLTPRLSPSSPVIPVIDEDITATVPDSPLFLPRTTSQISPLPSRDLPVDDSHVSFLSQALNLTKSRESISPVHEPIASTQSSVGNDSPRLSPEPQSSPVFHELFSANAPPDKSGSSLNSLKANGIHEASSAPVHTTSKPSMPFPPALPAQVRLFRRVLSENVERPGMVSEVLLDDSDDEMDSLTDLPENDMFGKSPTRLEKPQAQSHSFSDPVEIRPPSPTSRLAPSSPEADNDTQQIDADDVATSIPAITEATTEYVPVEESGPWTSTEAFLLFDWWPPGRQKPPYAANASAGTNGLERGQNNKMATSNVNLMSKKKYGTFGSAKFVSQR